MTIETILSLALVGSGALTAGLYLAGLERSGARRKGEEIDEHEEPFSGWDWLSADQRYRRLAHYHRRLAGRLSEREMAWPKRRLR